MYMYLQIMYIYICIYTYKQYVQDLLLLTNNTYKYIIILNADFKLGRILYQYRAWKIVYVYIYIYIYIYIYYL